MLSVGLAQTAGGLVQNEIYENGRALAFAGIGTRNPGAGLIPGNLGGLGQATPYAASTPMQINLTLNPQQTLDVFDGRTLRNLRFSWS